MSDEDKEKLAHLIARRMTEKYDIGGYWVVYDEGGFTDADENDIAATVLSVLKEM